MRRRSDEKRTEEEKREGLTKVDAANAPCAVLKAVGRRPLDKRRSATAIAIFLQVILSKTTPLMVYSSGTQQRASLLKLSLSVHTAMDFPYGNGMWKGRERGREGGREEAFSCWWKKEACGGGFMGALGVVHEQWLSWMSGGGRRWQQRAIYHHNHMGHDLSTLLRLFFFFFFLFFCLAFIDFRITLSSHLIASSSSSSSSSSSPTLSLHPSFGP